MTVDSGMFREAMSRLGMSVHVITSAGPAGRCGITATAVCPVTDAPPTMLVCINRGSDLNAVFKQNGVYCVNTLAAEHLELSNIFAGSTGAAMAERFGAGRWRSLETGAPVLADAVVSVDCRISDIKEVGTHSVLYGTVEAVRHGAARAALVYLQREYRSL